MVGQKIGYATLVTDDVHARLDGFTSLAVVLGIVGVMLGFPLADPIIGLIISAAIIILLWGTIRSIGWRLKDGSLMDGIEPDLVDRARHALENTRSHRRPTGPTSLGRAPPPRNCNLSRCRRAAISRRENLLAAEHNVVHALPSLDDLSIRAVTATAPTNTKSLPTVPSELPAIPRHAIHLRNRSRLSQWMLLEVGRLACAAGAERFAGLGRVGASGVAHHGSSHGLKCRREPVEFGGIQLARGRLQE